jgi:Flp pilus assembly protein protease CpaA
MYGVIFLWALALVYIVFAVIQDLRTREIANWITFSLAIFAIAFRLFYSLFEHDNFSFFFQGLIGLAIFFALGNLFYYSRVFAGGDAKLMIALGAILPLSVPLSQNILNFATFLILFLFSGFAYILVASIILCIKNFKAFKGEFKRQLKKNKKIILILNILAALLLLAAIFNPYTLVFGGLIILLVYLYLFSKSIDESCMVREIKSVHLREGDWLYSNVKMGNKTIKSNWDGLSKEDISMIRKKYDSTKIRQGIPFSPNFLISLIIFFLLKIFNFSLWNSFWKP